MQLKHPVDLDPENSMRDHIHNINHKHAIDEISQREVIVKPVDQTDLLSCEDRDLRQVEDHADNGSQHYQKSIPHPLISVVVL